MSACLDNDEMECCDEDVVSCLDEGQVACLDNNNKDNFDVYFLLPHRLEYLLKEILVGKFIVHYGYMKKIGWSETYFYFSHDNKYKTQCSTNQILMMGGREAGMIPKSTSNITINILSMTVKRRVADL